MNKKLLFIFLILFCFGFANGATITSTGTGNWSSTSSWVGGIVPTINDDVIIANGSTITINSNVSAKSITINGTLLDSGDRTVTTAAGNTLNVIINGVLGFTTNPAAIRFPSGTSIAINSPGFINDNGQCSGSVAIYIGTLKFATCDDSSAPYTFEDVNNSGGTLQSNPGSNAPGCEGSTLTFTAARKGLDGDSLSWQWSIKPPGASVFTTYPVNQSVVSFANPTLGTYEANLTYTTTYNGTSYSNSKTIFVTVNSKPAAPTISAGGPTTFCSGGSVTLTSSAGTSYLWSTGATTQSIAVTTSGSYTVQVGNASGCLSPASVATTVTVNPKPATPTISAGGSTTFCIGGSVTLTSSAGTSYLWSTGATTQSIVVSASGSYTVQITNASGCQSLASAATTVTVNPKPATPTISASGSTTFCSGGSVTLTSSAGSSYLWSTGATTQSIVVSASGSYTVQVTNASGCQSLASAATTVTVNPKPATPTISASGSTTFCSGGSVTLTSSVGTSYLWSTGATTQSIVVSASGSYTVQITNASGCQSLASAATTVTVNPKPATPTISASGSTTFCSGGSVTLTSSAGTSYLWSTGATTQSIVVSASGSYTVQITNASGCQSLASAATTVTVNPKPATPTISASGSTTFCIGGSVTLTSSVGTSYLWSTGATTQSIVVSASGSYTVQITNASGCQSLASAATTVTVNPKPATPTISASGSTTFCIGGSVTLTSSVGTSYLWSTGATTQSIVVSASGSYTVQITNASGCQSLASAATTVTVNPKPATPTISASGSTTFCSGGSVTLTSSAGSSYLWSTGATTQSIVVSASGSYTVQITNASGCQSLASAATTVTVNPKPATPIISASGSTTFCEGGNVTLTSSAGTSYLWSTGATTQSIVVSASGSYTVQITNASGCLSLASAATTVTVNPKPATPTISASGPTTFCEGDSVTLTSSAGSSYLWSTGATTQSIMVTTSGTYSVQVTNASGCQSLASAGTTVTVKPFLTLPTVFNIIQPTCVTSTGSISLSGLPITTSTTPTWTIQQNGPVSTSYVGSTDPYTITNLAPGIYSFTVQYGDNCPVTVNNVEIKASETNIWRGPSLGWSKGIAPTSTSTESIEFAEDYQSVGDLKGCSCKVDAGKKVTINSGNTLILDNGLIVDAGAGTSLTFEDSASLYQLNSVINTGNIIYKRNTTPVRRYDFTYWSTPITNSITPYTLHDLSPNTLFDKYASYNPQTGSWVYSINGTQVMVPAVGYWVRAPQPYSTTIAAIYTATFTGVPNNGDYSVQVYDTKWSLIGNPYPSAIDGEKFILINQAASVNVGALYFWTHNSPPAATGTGTYAYTSNDFAVFSLTGGTSTGAKLPDGTYGPPPTGMIASCQGFFMQGSGTQLVKFTNDMRIGGSNNQFYKTAQVKAIEKNRIWLDLSNTQGAFKQILVGYIEGATNGWDINYDAQTMNANSFIDFYSINDATKLTVQGRALPFQDIDRVPLGYKTTVAGNFTIAINHVDGLFNNNQAIYLEDKVTGIVQDLRVGNYTFTTAIGTFTDRFTISYTKKTLGTGDFVENIDNNVFVSVKDKNIKVTSTIEALEEVVIYDISGKMLYDKKNIGNTELQILDLQFSNQILLVKVILDNGYSISRKIVF
ncbi:T9SS sorting signal type C domain-containing protein [uncultured Flavobacterium sp.]|uniref:T9SS sorting signal type C domain-containing protein n=1 Tax=uncultured Flavobacterium sp. TaxID=165435 RepID=UPI002930510D|nr:T9SS sorting signal type C domain-containing protein [uncultured Flavobacterium sp.]